MNMSIEDAKHIIVHCPSLRDKRENMYIEINDLEREYNIIVLLNKRKISMW